MRTRDQAAYLPSFVVSSFTSFRSSPLRLLFGRKSNRQNRTVNFVLKKSKKKLFYNTWSWYLKKAKKRL